MNVHSVSYVPTHADPWVAFAVASRSGGQSPLWTEAPDPRTFIPPSDAAGRLWRAWEHTGEQVPPTIRDAADLLHAAFYGDDMALRVIAHAAYFSSGGAGIFLLSTGNEIYYILIARNGEEIPRYGVRERNLAAWGADVMMWDAEIYAITQMTENDMEARRQVALDAVIAREMEERR